MLLLFLLARALAIFCIVPLIGWLGVVCISKTLKQHREGVKTPERLAITLWRWSMTPGMEWLLIAWGIVTGVFIILLFYRSMLTRQEDDQLFIDESSSSRATEQSQLIAKVNKINPLVKMVGATSGLMILVVAGWAVYLGLNSVQP